MAKKAKKAPPRKAAPRKATKAAPRKAPPRKAAPRKAAPRKAVPRKAPPRKAAPVAAAAVEPEVAPAQAAVVAPSAPVEAPPVAPPPAEPAFVGLRSHPLAPAIEVAPLTKDERGRLMGILDRYGRSDEYLLAILQDIQTENNYLPRAWLEATCEILRMPRVRIYRMATFFKSLSLKPRGKHICQVCIGTTCHVRGAPRLVDKVELEMGVKAGETTKDMEFTVETVGCVGACALGPVVVLDKQYHGGMTAEKLGKVLRKLKGQSADAAAEEA